MSKWYARQTTFDSKSWISWVVPFIRRYFNMKGPWILNIDTSWWWWWWCMFWITTQLDQPHHTRPTLPLPPYNFYPFLEDFNESYQMWSCFRCGAFLCSQPKNDIVFSILALTSRSNKGDQVQYLVIHISCFKGAWWGQQSTMWCCFNDLKWTIVIIGVLESIWKLYIYIYSQDQEPPRWVFHKWMVPSRIQKVI
jgi:hypothetical protein